MITTLPYLLRRRAIFAGLFVLLGISCGPKTTKVVNSLPGYDINHPAKTIKFPQLLDEISGITYYPKDSSLFAVQDEEGFIYKFYPSKPDSMLRFKFGGRGDFEDIMLLDSTFYVLRSDGDIYATRIVGDIATEKFDFPEKGNEFEGIYYDTALRQLRLLCKDCKKDGKQYVSTYGFDPETKQYIIDSMHIDAKEIAQIIGEKKIKFKPSAVAVHPVTGKRFVISAVNLLLIVVNSDGSIERTCELDKAIYKQPEGLAFAPDGTMFITNESADIGAATLLVIPYNTTTAK